MNKVLILLNTIDKVTKFVNITSKYEYDFDLVSGRYVVDGKSILGIFSLDLSKPLELCINAKQDIECFPEELDTFIISGI